MELHALHDLEKASESMDATTLVTALQKCANLEANMHSYLFQMMYLIGKMAKVILHLRFAGNKSSAPFGVWCSKSLGKSRYTVIKR